MQGSQNQNKTKKNCLSKSKKLGKLASSSLLEIWNALLRYRQEEKLSSVAILEKSLRLIQCNIQAKNKDIFEHR